MASKRKMPSVKKVGAKILNSAQGFGLARGGVGLFNGVLGGSIFEALRIFEELYATDWQAQKIIDIPVDDMLRNPWIYEGLSDADARLVTAYQEDIGLEKILREALRVERLQGGSAIFIGVSSNTDNPELPLLLSDIKVGSLKFLNAIPRYRVVRERNQTDPTQPDYGRPLFYSVNGVRVHRSRLLIFDGDPMLPVQLGLTRAISFTNDGFGYPILLRLFVALTEATGSRADAARLVRIASVMVFSGDLQTLESTVQGQQQLSELESVLNDINVYNATILPSDPSNKATLQTLAANFGSVPELVLTYLQVLSAASDIPATRFLGQAPGGLNATGASDLENYYNSIAAKQRIRLQPKIKKVLDILVPSAGVVMPAEGLKIIFPPLWNAKETEQAQVRQVDTQNIMGMYNDGLIGDSEALEELKLREVLLTDPEDFPAPTRQPEQEEQTFDPQDQLAQLKKATTDVSNPESSEDNKEGQEPSSN